MAPVSLAYTNGGTAGCLISGSALGVITGSYTECGGTLTQTWTFTDDCNRTITDQQIITVLPAPEAAWTAPLADDEITCEEANVLAPVSLAYTNGGTAGCLISGSALGVITGSYTECGGTLTRAWTFTDDCNRTITDQQIITVLPAPEAAWTAPLADDEITCEEANVLAPVSLAYTNGGTAGCLISGSALGVITGSYTEWAYCDADLDIYR